MDWRYLKNYSCWLIVHITHWMVYLGSLVTLACIIAYEPWYLGILAIVTLGNPIIGGVHCAYNNIENTYRAALGWPLIEQNFLPAAIADLKQLIRRVKSCR